MLPCHWGAFVAEQHTVPEQKSLDFDNKPKKKIYLFIPNCSDFDRMVSILRTVEEGGKAVEEGMWR